MIIRREIAVAALIAALVGCAPSGVKPTPVDNETLPPVTTVPTQAVLAPSLAPATPTEQPNLAPTALPAPTEIIPPTAAPDETGTPGAVSAGGPGMLMNPGIGEPGDVVVVSGSGFVAGETISLHWNAADLKAPTGPVYIETIADSNGVFSAGLIIPPADKWPGGPPAERSLIQLRLTAPSLGFGWLYYNFTYVKRFNPQAATPVPAIATPTP